MKSLLFFDNSQSTRCHPPKGKIRAKNELRKTWLNCSSPFPSFFIHTKALFSLQFCAYLHPLTNSALLHSTLCSSAWVCFGSGSWAATAEAVRGNNRLLQVNSAVQTILFVPLHLQSPPLKSSRQPLQYELSRSNVPTFPASNHGRQRGFSVVKPQTTLSPSNALYQGCQEACGLSSWLNSHDTARGSQSTRFPSLNCARTQQHLEIS